MTIDVLILKAGREIDIKNAAGGVSFCRVRVYNPTLIPYIDIF